FRGEVRRRADRQRARALALQEALGTERDPVERVADDGEILAAALGDHQPLTLAVEELDAELLLQRLDLVAERAMRDAELLGRARKTFVARRGLEGAKRIERGQSPEHGSRSEVERHEKS